MLEPKRKMFWIGIFLGTIGTIHAIYDPANSGIKTKSYRRDPIIENVYEQQELPPQRSVTYHRTTTIERLSPVQTITSSSGHNVKEHTALPLPLSQSQSPSQHQYQHQQQGNDYYQQQIQQQQQQHYDQQQEIPLYERNTATPSISSNRGARDDVENVITEYYTGCPVGHTGQLPYAYDCRRFLNCWHGRGHIQSCGAGTVFNPQTLECDRPDKTNCGALGVLGETAAQSLQVPQSNIRNYRAGRLVADTEHIDLLCPHGVSGLQPHPRNCSKFINCANGNVHVQECGPGTAYSIPMMICDYKEKVDCSDRDYSYGDGMIDIRTYAKMLMSCPPGTDGLHLYPYLSTKYIKCDTNGRLFILECTQNFVFSISKRKCFPKQEVSSNDRVKYFNYNETAIQTTSKVNFENSILTQVFDSNRMVGCPLGMNGLFPNPFDSIMYIVCRDGEISIEMCASGTAFSLSKRKCLLRASLESSDMVLFHGEFTEEWTLDNGYRTGNFYLVCPSKIDDGIFLHPFDCTKYIRCQKGATRIESCAPSFVFSISKSKCVSRDQVEAFDRMDYFIDTQHEFSTEFDSQKNIVVCPPNANGLYAHPNDPRKYLKCSANIRTIVENCQPNSFFSISRRFCFRDSEVPEHDRSSYSRSYEQDLTSTTKHETKLALQVACPPGASGMQPHPYDCRKFLNCANGETHVQSCGPGTAWNIEMEVCDFEDKVDCANRLENIYTSNTQENQQQNTIYLQKGTSPKIECPYGIRDGFYPHPFDYTRYFNCNRGQTSIDYCKEDNVFSISRRCCERASKVNLRDRVSAKYREESHNYDFVTCPAKANGVYVYPFDCRKYLKCENAQTIIENCGPGRVFNMVSEACMLQDQVERVDRVDFMMENENAIEDWKYNNKNTVQTSLSQLRAPVCPTGANGLQPHPYDCKKFLNCANGETHVQSCGPGTAWNIEMEVCDFEDKVDCSTRNNWDNSWDVNEQQTKVSTAVNIACPRDIGEGFYAHPFDYTRYFICQHGQSFVGHCGQNKVFSLSRRICDAPSQVIITDRATLLDIDLTQNSNSITCPAKIFGVFVYPFDCTKYVRCDYGQTFIEACAPETAFSLTKRKCSPTAHMERMDRVAFITETQNDLYYWQNNEANMLILCPMGFTGFFQHPNDWTKYLDCSNNQAVVRVCPAGSVFSVSRGLCELELNVSYDDRCHRDQRAGEYINGLDIQKNEVASSHVDASSAPNCPKGANGMHPHPYDCQKFLNCANGIAYVQSCGPGTAWNSETKVCDFEQNVDCSARRDFRVGRISASETKDHNNRESKSYGSSSTTANQWTNTQDVQGLLSDNRQQTGSTTTNTYTDRWSNMHMARPNPNSYGHRSSNVDTATWTAQQQSSGNFNGLYGSSGSRQQPTTIVTDSDTNWSAVGSSIDRQTPGTNVLYMEGSLEPNRNYINTIHTYTAPLAPFSSNTATDLTTTSSKTGTTKIVYAQPVDSQESIDKPYGHTDTYPLPKPSSTRQNHSRNINHDINSNSWTPIVRHENTRETHTVQLPNQQLMPPINVPSSSDLNRNPVNIPATQLRPPSQYADDRQVPLNFDDGQFQISDYDQTQVASERRPISVSPVLMPPNNVPSSSNLNRNPMNIPATQLRPPSQHADDRQVPLSSDDGQFQISDYDQTQVASERRPITVLPTGELLPPIPPPPKNFNQQSFNSHTYEIPLTPISTKLTPINPNDNSNSNLYGGLQPPDVSPTPSYNSPTLVETNTTNVRVYQIYPPIHNATVSKSHGNPHYSLPYSGVSHSRNKTWINTDTTDESSPISEPSDRYPISTTDRKAVSLPQSYNRKYYKSTVETQPIEVATDLVDTNLPISDALRVLLRPYFNRSGTVNDNSAQEAESHIMNLIVDSQHSTTVATPIFVPPPLTSVTAPTASFTDAEDQQKQTEEDVELILAGEQHSLVTVSTRNATREVRRELHTNQEKSNQSNNWHHNREFHLRHPNLPSPFTSDSKDTDLHDEKHLHSYPHSHSHPNPHPHGHNHHHHQHHAHEHSRDFHLRHPEMPNPFTTREGDKSIVQPDLLETPNPYAEPTTPVSNSYSRKQFSGTNDDCQYDCGNGKCVKFSEICDGVNNCGNRKDETNCDHLDYEVRLTGGESPHMGRVEVKIRGKWGYVCDDKFGLRDADVVCRELGFNLGASEIRGNSYYPPVDVNFAFAMDEVECRGNETALKDCNFKGWGVHNCGPDEVVGVVCKVPLFKCPNNYWLCSTSKECIPPAFLCDNTPDCADQSDESEQVCKSPIEYRLEGGRNENEGRLEVKYRGEWGTVCDDDFGMKEAQVVCNSLGYYGKPQIEKNIYGPGSGPIWLDQVSCLGNETTIDKCNHWTWGEHNCNHTEDVGIRCTAGPPPRHLLNNGQKNNNEDDVQRPNLFDETELYQNSLERSSKFLRSQSNCGHFKSNIFDEYAHPEERVVNGTVAKRGRHPWQATIRTRGRGGISSHWCGAVLIADGSTHQSSHLLTAAHCLAGYQKGAYFIRMGDHYANIAESSEIDAYIENWYTHEKFRDQTHMNNDLALIVLKNPVRFNDYIQPICLPEKGASLQPERQCTISGWGSIKSGISTPSNILRAAQVPILPDETCKQPHVYGASLTEGMFCAGSMDESVDACDGDSGGPLVCSDDGAETLHGIISWGQHCGYANKPGVYVRIEKYIDWIYEKINYSLQQNGKN